MDDGSLGKCGCCEACENDDADGVVNPGHSSSFFCREMICLATPCVRLYRRWFGEEVVVVDGFGWLHG